jgi:hypothetical protein
MELRLLMAGVVKTPWPDDKKEKKNGQEGGVHCYGYVVYHLYGSARDTIKR